VHTEDKAVMEETHEFRVSAEEVECLKRLASFHEPFAGLLRFEEGSAGRRTTIRLSRAEAEQVRDYLIEQVALTGFDENYNPNKQGRMLEALIDRFYLS